MSSIKILTACLLASFLLICLYRWNSPEPAPAELQVKHSECQVRFSPPCLSPSHYVVVELRGLVDVSVLRSLGDEDWLVRLGHQPASYN